MTGMKEGITVSKPVPTGAAARAFAKHDLGIELYSITEGKGGQFMTVTGMTYQDRSGLEDGGPERLPRLVLAPAAEGAGR